MRPRLPRLAAVVALAMCAAGCTGGTAATSQPTTAPPTTAPAPATTAPQSGPLPPGQWRLLAAAGERLVVVGLGADGQPEVSIGDGAGWAPLPLPPFADAAVPLDLQADGGDLLLVLSGPRNEVWRLPPDAAAWQRAGEIGEPGEAVVRTLAADGDGWLAGGERGTAPAVWASADLAGWAAIPTFAADVSAGGVTGVARPDGGLLVVGVDAAGPFARTERGLWERVALSEDPRAQALSLLVDGRDLLAVGTSQGEAGALAWRSEDGGGRWTEAAIPDAFALFDVVAAPGGYLALGVTADDFAAALWESPDGLGWSRRR